MSNRFFRPVSALKVLAGFFLVGTLHACTPQAPSTQAALYHPRKDDLYLLHGHPFTLSEFQTLQTEFVSLKPENILRLAAYAREAQKISNPHIDLKRATEIVRNLIAPVPQGSGPASLNAESLKSFDAASPKDLEEKLRGRLVPGATQWNRPLLQEIGVSEPPWG